MPTPMFSIFSTNFELFILNSRQTSFDILSYVYSQGKEHFKTWISKKIFDWLGYQIVSFIFIKREINCNNSTGKSLEIFLTKNVFTSEKLSSSGTVVPRSFLDKKLKTEPPKRISRNQEQTPDDNNESWVLIPIHNSTTNFIYQGHYFWVSRKKINTQNEDKKSTKRADSSGDIFIINSFWFSKKKIDQLITESYTKYTEKTKRNIPMYLNGEFVGHVPERKMETILLANNDKDKILNDINRFLDPETQDWYKKKIGIPYRRGYLLYGPPGCGKTSFVKALANYLSLSLYIINLSSSELDDQKLLEMIHSCSHSIILFEDIDCVFGANEINHPKEPEISNKRNKKVSNQITFSGLLNTFDGVYAHQGNLIFMTTNHKEKLDPALIRPGRIDFEIEFGFASQECCFQLFKNFYSNYSNESFDSYINEIGTNISKAIPDKELSIAKIQGHFLKYRDPKLSLKNINEIISFEN